MRALVEKFPDGLQEVVKPAEKEYYDQSQTTKHFGELKLDPNIIAGKISSV